MSTMSYSLDTKDYTLSNAMCWGMCSRHWEKGHKAIACIEAIPVIGQIASLFEMIIVCGLAEDEVPPPLLERERVRRPTTERKTMHTTTSVSSSSRPAPAAPPIPALGDSAVEKVVKKTPPFNFYRLMKVEGALPTDEIILTGVNVRPANLFFEALFKDSPADKAIKVSQPGKGVLFRFNRPHQEVREYCLSQTGVVEFTAQGRKGKICKYDTRTGRGGIADVADLSTVFGKNTYRISFDEIKATLASQKIYTSALLPLPFYQGLKKAMAEDHVIVLPGHDGTPATLEDLLNSGDDVKVKHIREFLNDVKTDPKKYGIQINFDIYLRLTLYQIGSMVIKTEDYRIFIDGDGQILERNAGENDAIRLINACGIRGLHSDKTAQEYNKEIMMENFKTALTAAEKGFVLFPAVGMGVWRGDPDVYWSAFLDAVADKGDSIKQIFVNPGHAETMYGHYRGATGQELQYFVEKYLKIYAEDKKAVENLKKITNLLGLKTDLVQLAHNLKKEFPEETVSLFNASDPDVTLGYHVGEYVNNMPHTHTTEENYTAMGTNGLCFEGITGVHESEGRVIQA